MKTSLKHHLSNQLMLINKRQFIHKIQNIKHSSEDALFFKNEHGSVFYLCFLILFM